HEPDAARFERVVDQARIDCGNRRHAPADYTEPALEPSDRERGEGRSVANRYSTIAAGAAPALLSFARGGGPDANTDSAGDAHRRDGCARRASDARSRAGAQGPRVTGQSGGRAPERGARRAHQGAERA